MDYLNGSSYMIKVCDLGKESPLPPKSPLQCMLPTHADHFVKSAIGSQRVSKPTGEQQPQQQQRGQHYRTSSDSLLIEEQPFWLDELLTEPETPPPRPKGHRRSSSDPVAYLDSATNAIAYENILFGGPSSMLYDNNHYENHLWHPSSGSNHSVANKQQQNGAWEASLRSSFEKLGSNNLQKQVQEGKDGFSLNNDSSQGVSAFRNDSKRAKQQIAHRSRLRRLQYIAELERSVQMLQGEGSEVSAELEYLDHQVLILSMENRALKQRLDSLSQVQHLKHMEQDMLEREVGRLQFIYHQQQQQQLQPQQQQQQKQSTRRQSKNRDLVNQFPKLTL